MLFRKADAHYTAQISKTGTQVTFMFDDGFEDLIDSRVDVANEAKARALLASRGFYEFDANASLKAKGLVWNGYCYALPTAA